MKTDERCKGLKLLKTVNFKLFFILKLYFFYISNFYCCGNLCTHSDNMEMLTFAKPFSITKLLYRDGVLDSGAGYTVFSRPLQMAHLSTCLSVTAQGLTKMNSLLVKGQI